MGFAQECVQPNEADLTGKMIWYGREMVWEPGLVWEFLSIGSGCNDYVCHLDQAWLGKGTDVTGGKEVYVK